MIATKLARAAPMRAAIRLLSGERPVNSFPKTAANYRELTPLSYVERAAVVFDDSPAVVDGDATMAEIRRMSERCGMVLDPHTATGTAAARLLARTGARSGPMITLGTAHPAKFPEAIAQAGLDKVVALPPHLADLFERSERLAVLPNELAAVQAFIASNITA